MLKVLSRSGSGGLSRPRWPARAAQALRAGAGAIGSLLTASAKEGRSFPPEVFHLLYCMYFTYILTSASCRSMSARHRTSRQPDKQMDHRGVIHIRRLSFISTLIIASCAHTPADPAARADYERANDPAEPTNRAVFGANQVVDRNVLKPVATAYRDHMPNSVQRGIHNFVTNLGEPGVFVNDVLQGNVRRALNTTGRFVVNSSAGIGGLFDVADPLGLPHHKADFGQTFGVWGIGPGPAVQLPLLGPSDVRDSVGSLVGFIANPLSLIPGGTISTITMVGAGGEILDGRSQVLDTTDALERTSLDYYATLRSASAQRRAALVRDGKNGRVQSTEEGGVVTVGPVSAMPIVPAAH
jgi:phospholipid-binding lipoprotein MlaA